MCLSALAGIPILRFPNLYIRNRAVLVVRDLGTDYQLRLVITEWITHLNKTNR